ncbi:MAG TPA: class III extradiol ring-cleavage dioxygenase [Xanthomonadaceae bacterium]|nr:class III extradiol ring-cleavage dioxygenase [Xanthomonadaceae bacterium]
MDAPLRLPSLFLSHGSPMLAIEDSPAGRFLDGLGERLGQPRAIVIASAHFTTRQPALGADPRPPTVHDFNGFPPQLYQLQYPAPGDPELAGRVAGLLREAGLPAAPLVEHGLDHGIWVPLRRMYPQADIPVVPVAVVPQADARMHLALGRALAPLREQGVLVIGSGGFVHNLGDLAWHDRSAAMPGWATEFADWMRARLAGGDIDALLDWTSRAPHPQRAHPTPEHLLPLFVALGAAGPTPRSEVLHASHEYGSLALDAFAFE